MSRRAKTAAQDPDALVMPAFWHCPEFAVTIGPEVAELLDLFGYGPNPEQQLLLDGNFGMDKFGRLAAFEVFVLASRQNLKTGFLIQRSIGKAILLQRRLQVWTAHKESATDQAYAEFKRMAEESEEFGRRIKRMPEGKGSKAVEFVNGCTIVFRPRTGKAGQSMSADDVDLDEYFAVEPSHLGSLLPTLSTRPHAQVGGASSAPHANSNQQRAMMARGRAAAEGRAHEPRLLYAEWSVQRQVGSDLEGNTIYGPPPCRDPRCTHAIGNEGCIADDRELIKLANPSAGRSKAPAISWDYLADERRSLQNALEEYFRERLGAGVEGNEIEGATIFGPAEVWTGLRTTTPPEETAAVGLAMSADQARIALVGASIVEIEDPEDEEAEPTDLMVVAPILHTDDRELAVAELKRIQDKHDCTIPYDEKGPASNLEDELEDEDVAIEPYSLSKYARACSKFAERVRTGQLQYLENAELDKQVAAAEWRWVSDQRVIARREGQEAVDISLLEAAILAVAAAEYDTR